MKTEDTVQGTEQCEEKEIKKPEETVKPEGLKVTLGDLLRSKNEQRV